MRILIVAQYFPPDITAAAFRIFDTARLLEADGHEVHVVTAQPHRSQIDGDSIADYDRQISQVWRTRVAPLHGGGFRNYIRHYVSFMVGGTWLGLKERWRRWRPDVVWASSPPLFVGLSGVALARLHRCPLVVDIRDIWPASAVGVGQLSATGKAYRWGQKMERYVYDQASYITCVASPMRDYIRMKTRTPVAVIYNGTQAGDIVTDASDSGLRKERTLLYAGNFGRAQQLDLLIRAWANVRGRNGATPWKVRLLGAGVMEEELRRLTAELGMDESVEFSPPVSRKDAMRQMSRAAALSVSLQPDKVFEKTIPSKVFDCMAMARPVLAGVSGEGRAILESTGANLCYEPGNQRSLEQSLERLMRDYRQVCRLAHRNAQVVHDNYTREKATRTLQEVFRLVVGRKEVSVGHRPCRRDGESNRWSIELDTKGVPDGRIVDVSAEGATPASREEPAHGKSHSF